MKRLFTSSLILGCIFMLTPFFAIAQDADEPIAENVIMIIIDGIRYDHGFGAGPVNMPYLWNELGPQASINTSFYTETLTSTNSGHGSMVTGTWQVLRNDGSERPTMPTFTEYLRQQRGIEAHEAQVVTGKPKLDVLTYCTHPHFGPQFGGVAVASANFNAHNASGEVYKMDFEVFENAIEILQNDKPKHLVITFPSVDIYGHLDRFNDYIKAIQTADSLVYEIWQYIQSDPFYADKTIMTVTNDHGRHDDSNGGYQHHGCGCEGCRKIMFLAIGPGIKMNMTTDVRRTLIDIVPTAAEIIGGFENPLWAGRVMTEILTFDVEEPEFVPPVADGVVSLNEYGVHFNGINRGESSSQRWYMTYDDTNLYMAIRNANTSEGAVFYIDVNPLKPINGGTDADGSFVGQRYDGGNFEKLPFRADYVVYFRDTYREIRAANGTGGWGTNRTNIGTYASVPSATTRELIIPWTEFGFAPGEKPDQFAWIGYVAYSGGGVYGQVPRANPGPGTMGLTMRGSRYYMVDTRGDRPDPPFSKESYVYNRAASSGNIAAFGGIEVYDFTMNNVGRGITRTSAVSSTDWRDETAWTIRGDLRIDAGFIDFGESRSGVTVLGDVYIGSDGNLTLSNRVGGDLDIRGNWINEGAFNGNNRQIEFRGIQQQSLNRKETFDYMYVANSEGLVPNDSIFVTKRVVLAGGPVFNTEENNLVFDDDILVVRETGTLQAPPVYRGDVRLEYRGAVQVQTGYEIPDFPVKSVRVRNTAGVTVEQAPLLIRDLLWMDGGTLIVQNNEDMVLLSNEDGTARISGNGNIIGGYSMQQYIAGSAGWRLMSSPLGDVPVEFLANQLPIQGFPGANPTFPSNFYTGYDGSEWVKPASLSGNLEPGNSFIIYLFDNNEAGSSELPLTIMLGGREPDSDVTVPVHQSGDKWNMLGNPYSGPVDVRDFVANNGALATSVAQTWVNGTWVLSTSTNHLIQPWQGFFIQNQDASSITIPRTARLADMPAEFMIQFELSGVNNETQHTLTDRSLVLYFNEQATTGIDAWDAEKMFALSAEYAQIGFAAGNTLYAQRAFPMELNGNFNLPLSIVHSDISGEFSLAWKGTENLPTDWSLMLFDSVTNRSLDLTKADSYTFMLHGDSKDNDRFKLELKGRDGSGTSELPQEITLSQNYPNPFNPVTQITYTLPQMEDVRIDVFNVVGQRVATLVNSSVQAGVHTIAFDASRLASGVYIYRLQAGSKVISRKMTLVK